MPGRILFDLREERDIAVAHLCYVLDALENDKNITFSNDLIKWWAKHKQLNAKQKRDKEAKRKRDEKAQEAKEKKLARIKRVVSKLTRREISLLKRNKGEW